MIYFTQAIGPGRLVRPDFAQNQILFYHGTVLSVNSNYMTNPIRRSEAFPASHAIQKMMLYQRCGYITHTDLIYTFESDVEDPAVLDDIIKKFLL